MIVCYSLALLMTFLSVLTGGNWEAFFAAMLVMGVIKLEGWE